MLTLNQLQAASAENESLNRYLESYGGVERALKLVLQDFFKHAFDGSGALLLILFLLLSLYILKNVDAAIVHYSSYN